MSKPTVGIFFGGKSTEHKVSLLSAKNIIEAIDQNEYNIKLFGIDSDGMWYVLPHENYLVNADDPTLIKINTASASTISNKTVILEELMGLDVAFPIIHGAYGEDGSLQGLFKIADIPFVGSDVASSAICLDKDFTKRLLKEAGINVVQFKCLNAYGISEANLSQIIDELGLPLFVKPVNQGSSVGVTKVYTLDELEPALKAALCLDSKVIIEAAINGREIECAILGNEKPRASECGELILQSDYYSYASKYLSDMSPEILIPARLDSNTAIRIKDIAVRAYQILNCAGMARVDFFVTSDNNIFVNEVNTIPGFTNISMYPKLWMHAGVSYSRLISELIELALHRFQAVKS